MAKTLLCWYAAVCCVILRFKCFGVKLPEDSVSDAETCRNNIRLYSRVSNVDSLVLCMSDWFSEDAWNKNSQKSA
jgi:hypothetical protein